ncbi:MAG TPA: hypothetical protein VM580_35025 [Labilithrix sp.]|jgi:hypothetical protein|nr:hypothetical protein [Labilithrix sp.]
MNRRYAFLTAAFAVATMIGCAAPIDADEDFADSDEIGVVSSELKKKGCGDDDGPGNGNGNNSGVKKVELQALSGTTLTMTLPAGQTLTANIAPATDFLSANLSTFRPTDPFRPLVVNYNDALLSGRRGLILVAVQELATAGVSAQVRLNGSNIASFRPVR